MRRWPAFSRANYDYRKACNVIAAENFFKTAENFLKAEFSQGMTVDGVG